METMDQEIENEKVSPQVVQYMSSILTANRPDDDDDDEDLLEDSCPQVVGVLCKKRQSGGSQDKNDALLQDNDEAAVDKKVNHELNSVGLIAGLAVMASPRPKSPRPAPISAKKEDKEESFWDKIGTLGRKKRIKEVQEVQEEGKYAIDSPGFAALVDMPPEDYALDENEERSMIAPRSLDVPKVQELIHVLIEWINDELAEQRIIVKDITEDLYDGQVLQKLLEKLTGKKLDVPEVTQSEEGQRQKLAVVLNTANRVLGCYPPYKWSVESIHSRNIVAILHLLVSLARLFRAPVRLPELVSVQVVVVTKKDGQLIHKTVKEEITSTYDDLGMRCERDAFDALFDYAPDKLAVVKKSLVTFVNKHLSKVHLEVTDLDTQFHDGVFLTLLLGLLEGFFVPLGSFHLTPKTHEQKVHNVSFAFELMQDVGLPKPKARPEDIVNLDLKSTLRVLYNLFSKYKGIN
ncbi:beta-parvin isoform X1 [Nasonia vitripennis]|uniref:Calponin-homology (CH) domain-containing protein n=2 Tax=Nasonia vitripennis TaxID=7425 RepID=A0A7M7HDN2_NASVI|nr:beta-parvin isoform X1 [Nasonia vitripennis]